MTINGVDLPCATLLDVGASHGLVAVALAERVEWVLGIEVDARALAAARAEVPERGRLDLVLGSGTRLPFKDECMDLVVCNHVYEHVPDAPVTGQALRRCHRYGLGPRWLESVFAVLLPIPLARVIAFALPTHLWVLHK